MQKAMMIKYHYTIHHTYLLATFDNLSCAILCSAALAVAVPAWPSANAAGESAETATMSSPMAIAIV